MKLPNEFVAESRRTGAELHFQIRNERFVWHITTGECVYLGMLAQGSKGVTPYFVPTKATWKSMPEYEPEFKAFRWIWWHYQDPGFSKKCTIHDVTALKYDDLDPVIDDRFLRVGALMRDPPEGV